MTKDTGTTPSDETRAAEQAEAGAPHQPDRPPTAQEERAAPQSADPTAAESFDDMAKTGAQVKGEDSRPWTRTTGILPGW